MGTSFPQRSSMMPAGIIMRLQSRHRGKTVKDSPQAFPVTCSQLPGQTMYYRYQGCYTFMKNI
jgi:hypothetical protein